MRFLVGGGFAVTLHGYVHPTEDVDILLDPVEENVVRFLSCMVGLGERFARELSIDDFNDAEGAVGIVEAAEQIQLDGFTGMSGLHYSDVITDADSLELVTPSLRTAPYVSRALAVARFSPPNT